MSWFEIIVICAAAEIVALTIVFGFIAAAFMIAQALEEISLEERGEVSVTPQRSSNWFRTPRGED